MLRLLAEGTREHTITAFWEYVLLLEIAHKLLRDDERRHMRDHRLYDPYRELIEAYESDQYTAEGDFSERLSKLIERIRNDYDARFFDQPDTVLSQAEVTRLLYVHDVPRLRDKIEKYIKFKGSLWLLVDNLDKGCARMDSKSKTL